MSPRQLRIAMLSVHSCPLGILGSKDTGGMNVYVQELSRELGKRGHLVDVYTRLHNPRHNRIVHLGQNARLIHLRDGEGREVDKLAVYSYLPDFACHLESFRKRGGQQYDLVFSHYWLSAWVGQYLQQWWHVPHMTMFHTLGAAKNATGIGESESELRLDAERELAQNCRHIIASTEGERGELVRYYGASPERISVIPCGVNLELFQPLKRDLARRKLGLVGDRIILFVGRIEPLKGIEQLLKAIPYLPKTHGLQLVIIGGDEQSQDEIERLQRLSGELGIRDSVNFLGLVKHEEMPYFYSAADVCVLPSYYESFGLVVLESLACGTPVVATDVGDLKNIIRQGETGYVVADNAPYLLAEKIASLLSRSSSDEEYANSIRASVTQFSWSNIATAIIKEFHQISADYLAPAN